MKTAQINMKLWFVRYNQTLPDKNGHNITQTYDIIAISTTPENILRSIKEEVKGKISISKIKPITERVDLIENDIIQSLLSKKYPQIQEGLNKKKSIQIDKVIEDNGGFLPRWWNWDNKRMKT